MILDHQHGAVSNRCEHPACKAAFARYAKRWRVDRARGLKRTTDTRAAQLHIAALRGVGWSMRAIAGEVGLSATVPSRPSKGTTEPFVSRVGTVRRIQALLAIGWTAREIASHAGKTSSWVFNLLHQALSTRPGPSRKSITLAKRRGYVGPMSWDDIDHDPAPHLDDDQDQAGDDIDEVVVLRILDGDVVPSTRAERIEVARRWTAAGRSWKSLAQLTGWKIERYIPRQDGAA